MKTPMVMKARQKASSGMITHCSTRSRARSSTFGRVGCGRLLRVAAHQLQHVRHLERLRDLVLDRLDEGRELGAVGHDELRALALHALDRLGVELGVALALDHGSLAPGF